VKYFTVLLPVSNNASTLFNCLQSISSQSFTDYNVLVVINNSHDSSLQIAIDYSNKFLQFNIINLGTTVENLPQALNRGLDHIKLGCKYIVRHDADDYMLPDRLLWTFQSLQQYSVKPLIHCGNAYINNTSLLYFNKSHIPSSLTLKMSLLLQSPFIHPSICFQADKLLRYDERFTYAQDLKLFIDYFELGSFSFDSRPYIYYTNILPSIKKRYYQLILHDYALYTLHRLITPGTPLRISHYLRVKYITDEFTMYEPSPGLDLQSIYNFFYVKLESRLKNL